MINRLIDISALADVHFCTPFQIRGQVFSQL